MFRAALFITAKKWKRLKCTSTDEQINKMWYIHTTEYYLVLTANEVLIHATMWMNLESITLSERGQIHKHAHCILSLFALF